MDEHKFFKQKWEFSEARFEAIAQTATDAIVISDENSLIIFANKRAFEIFGYQENELLGLNLEVLIPEKHRNAHNKGMQRFIQSGVAKIIGHTIEIEGLRKDESVFPLELSLSCWQEHERYFFSGIIRDITLRKSHEKALQDTNNELTAALEELQSTEEQLIELNNKLEQKVELRTARLEAQKNELHNLFMQVPALIGILRGREGRVELMNATFSRLWGNRPAIGKTMREAFPEVEGQGYFEFIEKVYDTGAPVVKSEFPGYVDRHNSGTTELAYFDFIFSPYYDLDGKVDGVIIYAVDVTEHVMSRHQLEQLNNELAASEEEIRQTLDKTVELNEALSERENFLSSIIDQTPVATWVADATGTQVRVNEAYVKLFGAEYTSLGLGKYNILKDETLTDKCFYKKVRAVFTEGKVAKFSDWYNPQQAKHARLSADKQIYLLVTVFPIKNAAGKVTNAIFQYEDVTEKTRYEVALKASEEQLRMITDALPVLISYINSAQQYKFVNQTYSTWFHKTKEEFIGKPVWEVIGDAAYKRVKSNILKALSGQAVQYESHMTYKDAGERDVITNFIPHMVNNTTLGFIAIVTDISCLKKNQKELIEKNKALLKVNADLDSFIYIASHDLKSPIANIEGLTSILKDTMESKIDGMEAKVVNMLDFSVNKLKTTITDLTEISRIQKNVEEEEEEISFKEILESVKADIKTMINQSQASIREDLRVNAIFHARYNLRSIVYNLLTNAIKYRSPERPIEIVISTYLEKGFVILSVKDNGLGLSESQQSKIFKMFKRMHTHIEGTGIGLYIVKRIVENKGGSIVVESKPGQGTTFTVRFSKRQTKAD